MNTDEIYMSQILVPAYRDVDCLDSRREYWYPLWLKAILASHDLLSEKELEISDYDAAKDIFISLTKITVPYQQLRDHIKLAHPIHQVMLRIIKTINELKEFIDKFHKDPITNLYELAYTQKLIKEHWDNPKYHYKHEGCYSEFYDYFLAKLNRAQTRK